MIRFRLDYTVLEELPDGWDELDTTVRPERALLFLRSVVTDARFTFYRDGYRYLRDRWKQYGSECADVLLTVEEDATDSGNWRPILRGRVKIPALRWSAEPDAVVVGVEDVSYFAFLNNNKKIKVTPDLPLTKNGQPLTPVAPVPYDLFEPSSGSYNLVRDLYHLDELLTHLVTFLSDGEVGFRSTAFGPGGIYEGYGLQTIYRLRTALTDEQPLTYTLEELLREVGVNFNAALALEFDGARPVLRLEPADYLYDAAVRLDLTEVHPVTEEFDVARLYGTVNAGSELTQPQQGVLQFPEETRWRGFVKEQYYLTGQCNTSAELDLVRQWNVSSNVLEDALYQNVDTNDEEITWVQVDRGLGRAVQDNWLTSPLPYFYNRDLTNESVIRRWLGGIPSGLASELGLLPTGLFLASRTGAQYYGPYAAFIAGATTSNSVNPIEFDDDTTAPNFDAGGVYDPTLYRFTPTTAGAYQLQARVTLQTLLRVFQSTALVFRCTAQLYFERYDVTNTLVASYPGPVVNWSFDQYRQAPCPIFAYTTPADYYDTRVLQFSRSIPFDSGDYCVVRLDLFRYTVECTSTTGNPGNAEFHHWLLPDSTFACTLSSDFGNFTQEADPANFRAVLVKFQAPLTRQELDHLLADTTQRVRVTTQERTWSGWLESLKYDHGTGVAAFTLSTSTRLLP